jgi:hypothetical protein
MASAEQRTRGTLKRGRAALAFVAVTLVITACSTRTVPIDYYWIDADGQLVIQVTSGDLTTTKAIAIDETDDTVTVTVWLETAPLPMADIGRPVNLTVDLPAPLGGRQLVDGSSGTPVHLCRDVKACSERGERGDAAP